MRRPPNVSGISPSSPSTEKPMALIDIDLRPDTRKLRQFGFIALLVFGILGAYALWKGRLLGVELGASGESVGAALIGLGGLSAVLSLVAPSANRALYVGLLLVTVPIGVVVSYVLLGAVFYLLITPFGLFFRLVGRDPLQLERDPEAGSYWTVRESGKLDVARYFKQY